MDNWAKIRHLHSTGNYSKREIARTVGVSRGTVDRALEADRAPKYQRPPAGSSFDAFLPAVRELLAVSPTMPASTLAERVGFTGAASVFREKVAQIRPEYSPRDPADRLVHLPGEQVQCDLWFPHDPIPLGRDQAGTPPVLVMTSAYSGFIQALMVPSKMTPDLLGGMWLLLKHAQAVPKRLLWDNETGIGRGKLTDPAAAFAGTLGTEIKQLKPRDPESKGLVERINRYFRSSFLPGRHFSSPADFNRQLQLWLPIANSRMSRARRARPIDLIAEDRAAMRPLSPVAPEVLFRNTVRLPRDYYVRVLSNDYSVDPAAIGGLVDVTADLDRVLVTHNGVSAATHDRLWARQAIVTDPAHVVQAGLMRRQFQTLRNPFQSPGHHDAVEARSLATYDELFGVEPGAGLPAMEVFA